jgi:hypothetical protein
MTINVVMMYNQKSQGLGFFSLVVERGVPVQSLYPAATYNFFLHNLCMFLQFLLVRIKKQEFAHLKKQDFSHIDGCLVDGYECLLIYLMFFTDVNSNLCLLRFLSVRMKKTGFF